MAKDLQVAIQGVAGCFHDAAAREYFKDYHVTTIECDTFHDLFDTLQNSPSTIGIVAIENTIAGSLLQNHELLRQSNVKIIGEYRMHIAHVIAALPGQNLEELQEVNSHPMALRQCDKWLRQHPWMKVVEASDTAGSAKMIAEQKLKGHAAVCGKYAAQLYGLNILEENIQTNQRNSTRFLIVANKANTNIDSLNSGEGKSSIAFTLPHTKGTLSAVLTILSFYGINLTKIQSLPIIGQEWEYRFYIDLTFDDCVRYQQAINAVRPLINELKILGEYAEFNECRH